MDAKLIQVAPQTVDDFAELQKLRAAFAPTEARYQKLYRELKLLLDAQDQAMAYSASGTRFKLLISACNMETCVDPDKTKKKLGAAKFLECITISLKALAQYLTQPEISALTYQTQTGSRKYESIPLADA